MQNVESHPGVDPFGYIRRNVEKVREELADAARSAGVQPPRLIPVTKSAENEEFLAFLRLYPAVAAENRVQAWQERSALLAAAALPSPEWHLIGSLQTNKVKYVVGKVALIQSVDSEKLIREIGRIAVLRGVRQDILLEINSGKEEDKGGALPENALQLAEFANATPGVRLTGVMTMGPALPDPEATRPYFALTRGILDDLCARSLIAVDSPILSMGMSGSYIAAVKEGANMVRIGRALFAK